MTKLRISIPAVIEGGPTYERELAQFTYGENDAVLLLSKVPLPQMGLENAPAVICCGNAQTLLSCMNVLSREFQKQDAVTRLLLGLPLVDMAARRNFIPQNRAVSYLIALRRFSESDAKVRSALWEDCRLRVALHATSDVELDPAWIITPHKMVV